MPFFISARRDARVLQKLLAEMIFVAKAEIICNLLDADLFKAVKVGHRFFHFKIQNIAVYGFAERRFEFGFGGFNGNPKHVRKLIVAKKAFGIAVDNALQPLCNFSFS